MASPLWSSIDAARAACAELLPFVDILLPSLPADAAILPGPAHTLAAHVAVKLGEEGCDVWHGGERIAVPAVPATVIDTTGAGDCWNGTYLAALLRGDPAVQAAQFANAAAAAKLAHRGAIPLRSAA